jgi:hypothetical protein
MLLWVGWVTTDAGYAGGNIWTSGGPVGMGIADLVINPQDPQVLYVASDFDECMFWSTDGVVLA